MMSRFVTANRDPLCLIHPFGIGLAARGQAGTHRVAADDAVRPRSGRAAQICVGIGF